MTDDDQEPSEDDVAASSESSADRASEPQGGTITASRAWRLGRVLLAPVLATAAIGLHFVLNVPDQPVRQEPRDQGAEAATQRRAERAKRRRERLKFDPRPGPELDALLERYEDSDFEREPVVGKWARSTQTLLNKAVVMARKEAFAGAPEEPQVSVTRTQCRTIRCRLLLRSPYEHELQLLAATLQRFETAAGENIWRRYEIEVVDAPQPNKRRSQGQEEPGPKGPGKTEAGGDKREPVAAEDPDNGAEPTAAADHYLQITSVLIADDIEVDNLILGDKPADE